MKLLTYRKSEETQIGLLVQNVIFPLHKLGLNFKDMNQFICQHTKDQYLYLTELSKNYQAKVAKTLDFSKTTEVTPLLLSDVTLLAPIPNPLQDILCLGINYFDHASETEKIIDRKAAAAAENPIYFSKRAYTTVGHQAPIRGHFNIVKSLDYEVELAVIIGKDAYQIAPADVSSYIFGYSIINDISARELQKKYKQWYFAKSLDDFTALGPWIVTADEFSFPPNLAIQSFVNDELRQNSNTSNMIFKLPYIISELSQGITLKAGTIISTGTPAGVGMGFTPPKYLKEGDVVRCTIENIGSLENKIIT